MHYYKQDKKNKDGLKQYIVKSISTICKSSVPLDEGFGKQSFNGVHYQKIKVPCAQ